MRCMTSERTKLYVDRHALDTGGRFGWRESDKQGDFRWQIDGKDMDAFRCDECLTVCVNGPHMDGEAVVVVLEEQ